LQGKTSLIHRFLDRNEGAKETLALEYTFGRRAGKSLVGSELKGNEGMILIMLCIPQEIVIIDNRRSVLKQVKDVCHIWELGGGTLYPTLLSAPLAAASNDLSHLTVILMLDLAAPHQLWFTLETLIQNLHMVLRKQASALSGKNAGQFIAKLQEEAWQRVGRENEVKDTYLSC
jgi:dynein light intermediate chain 2